MSETWQWGQPWYLHDSSPDPQPVPETPPPKRRRGCSRVGPRPLVLMCIRALAANINSASEAVIEASEIPPLLIVGTWIKAKVHEPGQKGITLHAWKILTKLLLKDAEETVRAGDTAQFYLDQYRYQQTITKPVHELRVYTTPIVSSVNDFLTSLVIDQVSNFQANELVALAGMSNLSYLEIRDDRIMSTSCKLSDHLMRGWSETSDPFPSLRALKLRNAHSVSERSLQYVTGFPKLHIYDVVAAHVSKNKAAAVAEKLRWGAAYLKRPGERRHDFAIYFALLLDEWCEKTKNVASKGLLGLLFSDLRYDFPVTISAASETQPPPTEQDVEQAVKPVWEKMSSNNLEGTHFHSFKYPDPSNSWYRNAFTFMIETDEDDDFDRQVKSDTIAQRKLEPGSVYDWSRMTCEDSPCDGSADHLHEAGFWTCALTELREKGFGPAKLTVGFLHDKVTFPLPSKRFVSLRLIGEQNHTMEPVAYPNFIFHRTPPKQPEDQLKSLPLIMRVSGRGLQVLDMASRLPAAEAEKLRGMLQIWEQGPGTNAGVGPSAEIQPLGQKGERKRVNRSKGVKPGKMQKTSDILNSFNA